MIPTARSGWVLALDVLDLTGGTHPLAGDVGPGIEIGGDSVKKPGPRNLSCSGRARQHRGGNRRTPKSKKIKARHQYNHTLTCPFRATGSSRPPGRGGRGQCQAPQESRPNDRRTLGAFVIHAEEEQGFGGEEPGSALVCLRSRSPLTGGKGQRGAPEGARGKAPGPRLPDTGGSAEDTGHGGKGHTTGSGLDFFSPNPGAL